MKNTIQKLNKNIDKLLADYNRNMKDANSYLDKYNQFIAANNIDSDDNKDMLADLLKSKYQLLAQDTSTSFYHHFRKLIVDVDVNLDITINLDFFVQDLINHDYDANTIKTDLADKGTIAITIYKDTFSVDDVSFMC
ncbi:hypothetical protein ALC152_05150 [Arcobacter sp. 15-2]|uniref:hypothetical protein n=1 Tax=Arcobacter sp. 15-2 TaxID=3374109 RepID=UPI00399CD09A